MITNKNMIFTVTALMGVQLSLALQQQVPQATGFKVHEISMAEIVGIDTSGGAAALATIAEHNEKIRREHLNAHTAPHVREEDRVLLSQQIIMQDIHEAAKAGDIEALTHLLSQGIMVDIQTENGGYTALHFAARYGQEEAVKLLLQKGASITKKNATGTTALLFAAKKFKTAIVTLLLEHGSAVNELDNNGNSALYWAAMSLDHATIKVLLDAGANFAANKNGKTPLDVATKACEQIYEPGFDKSKMPEGWDPLRAFMLLLSVEQTEREAKTAHAEMQD